MARTTGTAPGEAFANAKGDRHSVAIGTAPGEAFANAIGGVKIVGELAVLSTADWTKGRRLSELAVLALGAKPSKYQYASEAVVLALTETAAKEEYVGQLAGLATIQGKVVDQISQVVVQALARTDPGKRQLRDFTFDQDGHTFVVLHLGNIGTIVYDQLTKKWSEWKTQGYNNWKANYGINWQSGAIAGSIDSNIVYNIDPDYMFDERNLPIVSVITGGYPLRLRASVACDEIMVTSSVGYVPGTVNSQLELSISDDWGLTFRSVGSLDMSTATPQTEVSWRSLGTMNAPGRIFQLTDKGGAAQRINSIEMFSRDLNDG